MLDFFSRPASAPAPSIAASTTEPTLADLLAYTAQREDLADATKQHYRQAIEKVAGIRTQDSSQIPATLLLTEVEFGLHGFDPRHWPSDRQYKDWRRCLQAALRKFLGVHDERARLRAVEDDWTLLCDAMDPAPEEGRASKWHYTKLGALRSFSLVARKHGWQPRDLTLVQARMLEEQSLGTEREANLRALKLLDELRAFPEALPFLPSEPIGFQRAPCQSHAAPLRPDWEEEIAEYATNITRTGWDPITKKHADTHEGQAKTIRSALRKTVRIGLEADLFGPDGPSLHEILADEEMVTDLAAGMLACHLKVKTEGYLAPRTSRHYLQALDQVRRHLGIDSDRLDQILANNEVARKGAEAEQSMTPKNRRFCEGLIHNGALRKRFLFSYLTLRAACEAILDLAAKENRTLTRRELNEVRSLGACACFAAIEIGGAPIRVGNAMALTCRGADAQIRIPAKGRKPIQVLIPENLTKNGRESKFPIKPDHLGYYDTIIWYMSVIRPLSPGHQASPYLFPSPRKTGVHRAPRHFAEIFANHMRAVVDLPMTPHQMRHGQTSLLLNRHPNEIATIAKRIDDTEATLLRTYAFVDAIRLVERGQDLIVELMND